MASALVSLFLSLSLGLSAASSDSLATINGKTVYQLKGEPKPLVAPDVFLRLIDGKDTIATQAGKDGSFQFKDVVPGRKHILATGISWLPTLIEIEICPGNNAVMVEMVPDVKTLAIAHIIAELAPVLQRGDTLIYTAAAVKTMEGENAIEILRQMPGVEIKGNEVYINGQKVERAYVNGLLLFGNDPMAPLNSIMAEDVRQIATYEEASVESRLRGDNNPEKERVIDIRTKEPLVNARDAYAQAAGGIDETPKDNGRLQNRYFAGANANFFSERFLIYANAYSNNLGVDHNILNGISTGSQREYHRKSFAAVGVEKYWGDRLLGSNVHVEYAYDASNRRNFERSLLAYKDEAGDPFRSLSDSTETKSGSGTHRFHISAVINDKTWKNWKAYSLLSINDNWAQSVSKQWNRMVSGAEMPLIEETGSKGRNIHGSGRVDWTNQYIKSKIRPTVSFSYSCNPSDNDNWTIDTLASSINRRYISAQGNGNNVNLSGSAGVSISLRNDDVATSYLSVGYDAEFIRNNTLQLAYDLYDAGGKLAEPEVNAVNTYDFSRNYYSHGPAGSLDFRNKDWQIHCAGTALFARQNDLERIPSSPAQTKDFFLPQANFFVKYKLLECDYNVRCEIPAVEQYRDRLNDSNPFFLVAGNPDLKPSARHEMTVKYNIPIVKRYATISFDARCVVVSNAIVNTKDYFSEAETLDKYGYKVIPGATLSSYTNTSGNLFANAGVLYMKRLQKRGLAITAGSGVQYSQTPYFQGDTKVYVRDLIPSGRIEVSYRPRKEFSGSIRYKAEYIESANSLGQTMTQAVRNNLALRGSYNIGKYWFIAADYIFNGYVFIEGGRPAVNHHYLGGAAGLRLMKGRLNISLRGNDLLNNGYSYSIQTNDDYVKQTWTPSFGRYYLITVSFRLNKLQPATKYSGRLSTGQDPLSH